MESNKKIIEASSQEITFVDPKPTTEDPVMSKETEASETVEAEAVEKEEHAKPVNYEFSELFSEPKEDAQVCEKKKADLRAKFEINQIIRNEDFNRYHFYLQCHHNSRGLDTEPDV